jgi:hypothetical protein
MRVFTKQIQLATTFLTALLLITSCASPLKFTSSWSNKQAKVKTSPVIMVMVLGKPNSEVRKEMENNIVSRLKKDGFKALPASGLFQPGVVKYDSAQLVSILRKNNIDMLLTNAVVSRTENERFIPGTLQGTDIVVPAGGTANPNNPYNGVTYGYNSYYNYYNYYNTYNSYQTVESTPQVGTTITDVFIVIESNLYEVATPQLIWRGQSTSTTKDPTEREINSFTKAVISDIKKNNLLIK